MKESKYFKISLYIIFVCVLYNFSWAVFYLTKYPLKGNLHVENIPYFLYLLKLVLSVVGLVLAQQSNFKKVSLLSFIASIEVVNAPFLISGYVYIFFAVESSYNKMNIRLEENTKLIISFIMSLAEIVTSVIILHTIQKNKTIYLKYESEGDSTFGIFEAAPKGLRFLNRLIDFVVFFYIVGNSFLLRKFIGFGSYKGILTLEIPFLIYYYLILEGIFNTTAGKCLTNTTLTGETGLRPVFKEVFLRTICRYIPFEAFSFLNARNRGWHDAISDTYVVKSKMNC